VWAQMLLERLRRELREAVALATRALMDTDPDGSDAVIRTFNTSQSDYPDVGLGKHITVTFRLGPEWDSTVDIRADRESGTLVMHGADTIAIHPKSSNSVEIHLPRKR